VAITKKKETPVDLGRRYSSVNAAFADFISHPGVTGRKRVLGAEEAVPNVNEGLDPRAAPAEDQLSPAAELSDIREPHEGGVCLSEGPGKAPVTGKKSVKKRKKRAVNLAHLEDAEVPF